MVGVIEHFLGKQMLRSISCRISIGQCSASICVGTGQEHQSCEAMTMQASVHSISALELGCPLRDGTCPSNCSTEDLWSMSSPLSMQHWPGARQSFWKRATVRWLQDLMDSLGLWTFHIPSTWGSVSILTEIQCVYE